MAKLTLQDAGSNSPIPGLLVIDDDTGQPLGQTLSDGTILTGSASSVTINPPGALHNRVYETKTVTVNGDAVILLGPP
jgi:hypothetical protein